MWLYDAATTFRTGLMLLFFFTYTYIIKYSIYTKTYIYFIMVFFQRHNIITHTHIIYIIVFVSID